MYLKQANLSRCTWSFLAVDQLEIYYRSLLDPPLESILKLHETQKIQVIYTCNSLKHVTDDFPTSVLISISHNNTSPNSDSVIRKVARLSTSKSFQTRLKTGQPPATTSTGTIDSSDNRLKRKSIVPPSANQQQSSAAAANAAANEVDIAGAHPVDSVDGQMEVNAVANNLARESSVR